MKSLSSFAVLNPGGRDADLEFPDFAGLPNEKRHPPVNFHGFAAATGGGFFRTTTKVIELGSENILLLLRSDLGASLRSLFVLKGGKRRVFISFKEAGSHQISQTLAKKNNLDLFRQLCGLADGAISVTDDCASFYRAGGCREIHFLPTPYPVEDPHWDFSIPIAERKGIFIGTREFKVPSRNHLAVLLLAGKMAEKAGVFVSVCNTEGRFGQKLLRNLTSLFPGLDLRIWQGKQNYPAYLRAMASHRIVLQLDGSAVPGQVAGDALLCGLPCVGGNGTTERLVFPDLTSHGRSWPEVSELAARLLGDPVFYAEEVQKSRAAGLARFSFGNCRERLAEIFTSQNARSI